ncbi:MAG TPA: cytochrome c oxidase assembly protein [Roseiflexaceae bacterium]|nr:cytochrome c oxidase assembly protein [Roseiflexaceae bacterium]
MFRWNLEPTLIAGLIGQVAAYLACVGPLRSWFPGARPVPLSQIVAFVLGSLTMFAALVSPLDKLGEGYLLSAHMLQHMLITLVAPPLMLKGTPTWLLRPLLRLPLALPVGRAITHPIITFALFNGVFLAWHVPDFYELALRNQLFHILEHVLFFGTATLTWWPIFSPLEELPPRSPGMQILYLFLQSIPPTILGAVITFAEGVIYPTYASAPRVWDVTALDDQRIAGLLMWIPGSLVYFGVLTVIFFRWFNANEDSPVPAGRGA